jgi:aminopeptidase N
MVHTLLGEKLFRKGMDLYFKRHDGQAATVEDFIQCFADVSGRDFAQFMTWYSQAGTPGLVCDLKYNADKRTADLTVEQVLPPTPGQQTKKPLQIPLQLGLLGGNGNDLPLETAGASKAENGVLEITKRRETFRFVDVPSRPVPSLLRNFSAPVNLTIELSDDDLAFLMSHDSDEFIRWQASQDYATRLLTASVRALRKEKPLPDPSRFIDALGEIVTNARLEPSFRAQALTLPSETDVARVIAENIDPDSIHKARKTLRRKLAQRLGAKLEAIYAEMAVKEAYAPVPDQIQRRALRNSVLGLLIARGTAADVARAARHFASAGNLTDEIAGLAALSETRGPERKEAFDRFYERWHDDHIVIDHWFLYQAAIPQPGTLAIVKKLARHPLMSLENPNKVRTLIGAFAANPVAFNRPDGAGYEFVGERILEIDRFNPQLAARLLTGFRSWRTLESTRRKLAERVLKNISKSKQLSRDVYEIVTRMLD